MTNVKGFSPETGSAPQALGPRPTLPARRLTAEMNPRLRDIDWNGHVPTAPRGPVTMTAAQVREQLAQAEADDNERVIPTVPGPRRSPEAPKPKAYDKVVLGHCIPAHLTAFGAA